MNGHRDRVKVTQDTWFIDADNGDDSKNGATRKTALKTIPAFCKRVRFAQFQHPTVVEIYGSPEGALLGEWSFSEGASIRFDGISGIRARTSLVWLRGFVRDVRRALLGSIE